MHFYTCLDFFRLSILWCDMDIKHIVVSLLIRVILGAQYQLPIRGYYTDKFSEMWRKMEFKLRSDL